MRLTLRSVRFGGVAPAGGAAPSLRLLVSLQIRVGQRPEAAGSRGQDENRSDSFYIRQTHGNRSRAPGLRRLKRLNLALCCSEVLGRCVRPDGAST